MRSSPAVAIAQRPASVDVARPRTLLAIAFVFLLVSNATRAQAQPTDACQDPADLPFRDCLAEVGQYTKWMVVAGSEATNGELQATVDALYTGLEAEWPSSLTRQTHVKAVLFWIPFLLTIYVFVVWLVGRVRPPILRASGRANWRLEQFTIVMGVLVVLLVYVGERYVAYQRIDALYRSIAPAVEGFLHLTPPSALANIPEPCQGFATNNDLLSAMCDETWVPPSSVAHLVRQRVLKAPALHQQLRAIGTACRSVGAAPPWWARAEQGDPERLIKMDCDVVTEGKSIVRRGDFSGLGDLDKWLIAQPSQNAVQLRLESIFNVRSLAAEPVYTQKVQALMGDHGFFDEFRQRFQQISQYGGIVLGTLTALLAVTLFVARAGELNHASVSAYKVRRRVLVGVMMVGAVLAAAAAFLISS